VYFFGKIVTYNVKILFLLAITQTTNNMTTSKIKVTTYCDKIPTVITLSAIVVESNTQRSIRGAQCRITETRNRRTLTT
jgi:multisubunit Na+/H+ antiporter MnhC subunit